jgi:hypothetical protein
VTTISAAAQGPIPDPAQRPVTPFFTKSSRAPFSMIGSTPEPRVGRALP